MTTKYMHLINGEPAFYTAEQQQICFWVRYGPAPEMAESLKQIRKEQKASLKYRLACGFADDYPCEYSHIRVQV